MSQSKSKLIFNENVKDIDHLLEFRKLKASGGSGRQPPGLEVLSKSAIVLITSFWEAYCEDVASEALLHIVDNARSSEDVPKELRKQISKKIKEDPNELSVWDISDEKWRGHLKQRLDRLKEERNRKLNTPKAEFVDKLFEDTIGIKKISSSWYWQKMSADNVRKKLDDYITLRGEIAHRGKASRSVRHGRVTDYRAFIIDLAKRTDDKVDAHLRSTVKVPFF